MSPQGISYMLDGIARVSRGLTGRAAVDAIVRRFERPANPDAEVAKASGYLGATLPAGASTQSLGSQGNSPAIRRQPGLSPLLTFIAQSNKAVGLPALNFPTLGGFNTATSPSAPPLQPTQVGKGEQIAHTAMTQLGQDYQWGGRATLNSPTDCSGLVQAAMLSNGVKGVPRTTYEQWKFGRAVDPQHLAPGDAVFFHMTDRGPSHVGIYLGDGKFINDPQTGAKVRVDDLASYGGFVGARRFV